MPILKLGESNESEAKKKYQELMNVVKNAEGTAIDKLLVVNTNDGKTSFFTENLERIDSDLAAYKCLCGTSPIAIVRRRIGRSGQSKFARQLVLDILTLLDFLTQTTHQRGEYKILSPLAFNPNLASIPELETAGNFKGTWTIDFKWISGSTHNFSALACYSSGAPFLAGSIASLMEELDFTYHALLAWWREHHLDGNYPETDIWNDMRALARKMVFLLEDYKNDEENEDKEAADSEQNTLEECIARGQNAAVSIIKLVDRYPSEVENIRPSVEIFIPIVFVLFKCLKLPKPGILDMIRQTLQNLQSFITELGGRLISQQHSVAAISEQGNPTSLSFSIQDLKRLQLERIEVERDHLGILGDGSSANVRKYNTLDHSQQYAVKIYRVDNADFNEQRHWNATYHTRSRILDQGQTQKINKLKGFCTFEDSAYPGLAMDVCEENLSQFCSVRSISDEHKLELMHDVASGLAYLHDNRYVHGDLRPANILIKKSFVPNRRIAVLSDFGFADTTGESFTRISMRTDGQRAPETYRPPELFKNRSVRKIMLSTEADVYAFGCVFAEILYKTTLYYNAQEPIQKLKKDAVYPVKSEEISNTKHWMLLCQVWDARPDKRPIASYLVDTLRQFVIDSRSLSTS